MTRIRLVNYRWTGGFTLIETAIVLLILGLMLSGLLVALSENREGTQRSDTLAEIRRIEKALYGFAQTYGRLPCPARHDSNGAEAPAGGGVCTSRHGFVPVATLGLQGSVNADGLLVDAWANPYRYSVATNPQFTSAAGLRAAFANPGTIIGDDMLSICPESACATFIAEDNVVAVVLSMGMNWPTYSSADETQNAGDGSSMLGAYRIKSNANNEFVSTTYRGETYDDMVTWISPPVLFTRMISAGMLP